jgi:hypothetical protein
LVIFNFYLGHIKELTYKSEDLLQNQLLTRLGGNGRIRVMGVQELERNWEAGVGKKWGCRNWKEMGEWMGEKIRGQ